MFQSDSIPVTDTIPAGSGVFDIFGEKTVLATGDAATYGVEYAEGFITATTAFSVAVIAVFVAYCLILYSFLPQAGQLLASGWNKSQMEKTVSGHNRLFDILTNALLLTGAAALSLVLIRACDGRALEHLQGDFGSWQTAGICAAVFACVVVVWWLQNLILALSGKVSLSSSFTHEIWNIRRISASLAALLLTPVTLMYALSDGTCGNVLFIIAATLAVLLYIHFLARTYILFVERKVSIFYWILYLCAVELFPVSLPVLVLIKHIH